MHEMSTVIRLVNMASSVAVENNATSVKKIKVAIGEMTGVLPEYVRKYYHEAVKGTMLEGSELEIEEVPLLGECQECQEKFRPDKSNDYACPKCHSSNCKILQGRKTELVSIAFE